MCILLGPATQVPQDILINALLDFITTDERRTIQEALIYKNEDSFPSHIMKDLLTILIQILPPKPSTLVSIIQQVAKYEFIVKPATGIGLINSGIPQNHREFWNMLSTKKIQKLYEDLTFSSRKVLS